MKVITQPNYKKYIFIFFCLVFQITTFAQTQKGTDIDGKISDDSEDKESISMPDANTVAIVSSEFSRIYSWNGSVWLQKGTDIDCEVEGYYSGASISMPDANTVAIGYSKIARIYSWSGTVWVQKGADIEGNIDTLMDGSPEYFYHDWYVSMPDVNTLAIVATYRNNVDGKDEGHVRIYSWSGTAWVQKGADIDGEHYKDYHRYSVSMPDANTVAIGAPNNSGKADDAGHVRIYTWKGSAWVQKGTDIDGEAEGDYSGYSVSMPDANTVAIGAPNNSGTSENEGHVRIYSWSGTAWVQKGADIDGENYNDCSGESVSMPDANTVAIGAPDNSGKADDAGHVRIYTWKGSAWVQKGTDIDGEAEGDYSGYSVSMPDANTVAILAPYNSGKGSDVGHVRIYTLNNNLNIEKNDFGPVLKAFPNPTLGELNVELGTMYQNVTVIIKNSLGQKLFEKWFNKEHLLNLNIPDKSGVYLIEIQADDKSAILKVIKK